MVEYTLEFRTLAARSEWDKSAHTAVLCQGLNPEVLTELVEMIRFPEIISLT